MPRYRARFSAGAPTTVTLSRVTVGSDEATDTEAMTIDRKRWYRDGAKRMLRRSDQSCMQRSEVGVPFRQGGAKQLVRSSFLNTRAN